MSTAMERFETELAEMHQDTDAEVPDEPLHPTIAASDGFMAAAAFSAAATSSARPPPSPPQPTDP